MIRFLRPVSLAFALVLSIADARAEPGFFSPRSADVPQAVQDASEGVYRYVILANPPFTVFEFDYDAMITLLKRAGGFGAEQIVPLLEECKRKQAKECENPFVGNGTAFVTGANHDRLWTVRHNLVPDLEIQGLDPAKIGAADAHKISLNFALVDRDGKFVFDTRKGDSASPLLLGAPEMISHIGLIDPQSEPDQGINKGPMDFAYIKLSRPVGNRSLKLRKTRPVPGERLSVIGYPMATRNRLLFDQRPDSDGISQLLSRGTVTDLKKTLEFFLSVPGKRYVMDPVRDPIAYGSFAFVDSEAIEGFSGGPYVDDSGKVAAILTGYQANSAEILPGFIDLLQSLKDPRTYLPHNARSLHVEWLLTHLEKYGPAGER